MIQFLRTAVLLGLRGRAVLSILVLGLALLGASYFAADFSPRQPQAVALDVGLSFLRFSLVLLAVTWVQELVGKEFERKSVLVSFSYPVPRSCYVLGRYAGIMCLLAGATSALGAFLAWVVSVSAHDYIQAQPVDMGIAYVMTLLGIFLDVAVVASFSLLVACLSTVPLLPLATGAMFAIAGRSLGPVLEYLRLGAEGDAELAAHYRPLLDVIQWILPDLSRLDWRTWPMYQLHADWTVMGWSVLMAFAYSGPMLLLAVIGANRRELT